MMNHAKSFLRRVAHPPTPLERTPLNFRLPHPLVFEGYGFRHGIGRAAARSNEITPNAPPTERADRFSNFDLSGHTTTQDLGGY
jgi:hypothetical protein